MKNTNTTKIYSQSKLIDRTLKALNKDKPKNRQIALVKLRTKEFPRNNNTKILRKKVIEEDESEE